MTTEIGGLKIEFGDPRQPKALPLSHPKARWGDFGTETIVLKKGSIRRRGCLALPCDILFERDVVVELRDGTKIYVDVYRPVDQSTKAPALMAWSPYGKQGGRGNQVLDDFPFRMGVPLSKLSEWQKWEGPDPAYWVQYGYAIVNPDPRGVGKSEGDIYNFGSQEGRDGADVIDWIGSRDWCNGKVSMSGNSYLSISQWFIAAEQPKHLAAIAPWEGFSDLFRESGSRGGVASRPAATFLLQILQVNFGENSWENSLIMQHLHPEFKEYHKDKAAKVDRINVPAYVTASWSNPIHTYGTFRAFSRLTGPKWLRVHDSWEWPDYYEEANRADLHRFYDYFLKGIDNGWPNTPVFRAKILDTASPLPLTGSSLVSSSFPPAEHRPLKLFLDDDRLTTVYPPPSKVTYKASKKDVAFEYTFEQDTICCGPVEMALAVSLDKAKDSDVFASFEKVLLTGAVGEQLKVPFDKSIQSTLVRTAHRTGILGVTKVLMYRGPYGQVRLSRRALDTSNEVPGFPLSLMEQVEAVPANEILHVRLAVTPIGMRFNKGEKLRVLIGGVDKAVYPPVDQATLTIPDEEGIELEVAKEGVVTVHCGLPDTSQASYIVLPIIP